MNALRFALASTGLVLAWTAAFRLPFRSPARRYRMGMWLSDRTGLRADAAFALFGTVLYLGLGLAVLIALNWCAPIPWQSFFGLHPPAAAALTLLGISGVSCLNALSMSILYRIDPQIDVPGEVARIQWVNSVMSLPRSARWLVPALAAAAEELVFRGGIFLGMGASGASLVQAAALSTALFAVGQVLMVSTRTQAIVMSVSSFNLGVVDALLVASAGSVIPALIVHASFAGFYTNLSAASATTNSVTRRLSL